MIINIYLLSTSKQICNSTLKKYIIVILSNFRKLSGTILAYFSRVLYRCQETNPSFSRTSKQLCEGSLFLDPSGDFDDDSYRKNKFSQELLIWFVLGGVFF